MKTSAGNLTKGSFVEHNNDIYQVQKIEHNFRGRGSANLKIKLKGVSGGNTLEQTYKPDNAVEQVQVESILMQYLFGDGDTVTFMNEQTFDQLEAPARMIEDFANYIKEGQKMYVILHDGRVLAIRPPQTVRLEVIQADEAVKGDTATGAKKSVTVETGADVLVPLFIKKGDTISINPETGEYLERV